MPLNLKSVANGSVILNPASTVTDKTITLPATDGTMVVQDSSNITSVANLNFTGTGNRITGDFSNATFANRVAFQSNVTNGVTGIQAVPNGTNQTATFDVYNAADPTNASFGQLQVNATDVRVVSNIRGTGTYLPMTFATGGSERLRLDTSGNLGLGVTPSAWGGSSALQIGNASLSFVTSIPTGVWLRSNSYFDGTNNRYIVTGAAATYRQNGGIHFWETAPSGTAGNAISFTQAMTLDSAGALCVGMTTPLLSSSGRGNITLNGSSNSVLAFGAAGVLSGYVYSSSTNLEIDAQGSRYIQFNTNGSERARIDTSGNLLVGCTALPNGTSQYGAAFSADTSNRRALYLASSTTSTVNLAVFFNPNGSVGLISTSGTGTTFATTSDYRLKENVQPMQNALSTVAQLKPCTYNWKADGSAGQGFIAHELQAVVPDAVTGEKDAVNEDGSIKPQGIDTSFLVATLTAAIQEQQALIQSLTARLEALEAA